MIAKSLLGITEGDLDELVVNSVAEGKTIEYKKALPGNSDGEKKEFLADVSSFANTAGGDLIFGVEESQGAPTGIPGLGLPDQDLEVRRLDSLINDGLEPRIRFGIRIIQRTAKLPALIVRTERSWIGPHRVILKGHDKFYARNSAGKYPMDVSELRSAFTLADSVTERVRQFRNERIAQVRKNKTPIVLTPGPSKTMLHCIPLESFARSVDYDVLKYRQRVTEFPPMVTGSGWGTKINFDGLVTHDVGADGSKSYTQLFRNGTIEATEAYWLNVVHKGSRTFPHLAVEQELLKYLGKLLELQKQLGVNPPVIVALTMVGTKGLQMGFDIYSFDRGNPIGEEDLILPETVVESFEEPTGKILKPLFDLVWNACGYLKSKNFDDQCNWIGRGT